MAEAESNHLLCKTDDCQKRAVKFCKTCETVFCSTHVQAHDELTKGLKIQHYEITLEYERTEREENSQYYTQHGKEHLLSACQHSQQSQCTECMLDSRFMMDCSLTTIGDTVMLPVSCQTETSVQPLCGNQGDETPTVRMPTNLKLKREIDVQAISRCIQYSQTGSLLHSGDYKLSGLEFSPSFPNGQNISLCEHRSSLYVLQMFDGNYHVHVINVDNQSINLSVITYPFTGNYQHLSVTDQLVLIPNYISSAINVYSATTYNHLFEIKNTTIFSKPYSVAVLGDALIVGEWGNNNIINLAISQTPEVKWKECIGKKPRAIEVKDSFQIILIGSYRQVRIFSYHGDNLRTFDTPQCSGFYDLSSYGNEIAVVDWTKKIKVYEMKYEQC